MSLASLHATLSILLCIVLNTPLCMSTNLSRIRSRLLDIICSRSVLALIFFTAHSSSARHSSFVSLDPHACILTGPGVLFCLSHLLVQLKLVHSPSSTSTWHFRPKSIWTEPCFDSHHINSLFAICRFRNFLTSGPGLEDTELRFTPY